jgi:hypothetical protein
MEWIQKKIAAQSSEIEHLPICTRTWVTYPGEEERQLRVREGVGVRVRKIKLERVIYISSRKILFCILYIEMNQ